MNALAERRTQLLVDFDRYQLAQMEATNALRGRSNQVSQLQNQVEERAKIEAKAQVWLESVIGSAAYSHLTYQNYIDVPSRRYAEVVYRLLNSAHGGYIMKGENAIGSLCVFCSARELPHADQMLTLILMARYQEDRLLSDSNVSWAYNFSWAALARLRSDGRHQE